MKNSITPDYWSFNESFDDLYIQIDDVDKYLVTYLRESIPMECGFWFFDILESIVSSIYYKNHQIYPPAAHCFHLAKEYIWKLFQEWKIKVKLVTPSPQLSESREEWWKFIKYNWNDEVIYENSDLAKELMDDMQKRYDQLSLEETYWEEVKKIAESELVRMYHGHCIIISYGDKPFIDEL